MVLEEIVALVTWSYNLMTVCQTATALMSVCHTAQFAGILPVWQTLSIWHHLLIRTCYLLTRLSLIENTNCSQIQLEKWVTRTGLLRTCKNILDPHNDLLLSAWHFLWGFCWFQPWRRVSSQNKGRQKNSQSMFPQRLSKCHRNNCKDD